jgi:hypothetical protein
LEAAAVFGNFFRFLRFLGLLICYSKLVDELPCLMCMTGVGPGHQTSINYLNPLFIGLLIAGYIAIAAGSLMQHCSGISNI